MNKPIQKRTLETRMRLLDAAEAVAEAGGFDALRVEEVVQRAGVAKGTFFAHFKDKEALMDLLIGARLDRHLDAVEVMPTPQSVEDMIQSLAPLMGFMTSERYVFDVILRHSGAAAIEEIGAIAGFFYRFDGVVARWLEGGPFRKDVSAGMLAQGVGAFGIQAMALRFCALHADVDLHERLKDYLEAWLLPASAPSTR